MVVRDKYSTILEHRRLEPGSDLHGAFVKALAAHVDDGWQMETFSSTQACAFCRRAGERRMISVEQQDPLTHARQTFSPW